jgi:Ferritin-like domain
MQCLSIDLVTSMSRRALLRRGSVLLLASPALSFAPAEAGAAPPSDGDLAHARLLVTCELLAADFYRRALRSKRLVRETGELKRLLADERDHLNAVRGILVSAGQTPATSADVDFVYPRRTFASSTSIAALGVRLESLFLRAYLGAVAGFEASGLKLVAARIAASEAQHLSVLAGEAGGARVGAALPRPLTIDRASDQLDRFTA